MLLDSLDTFRINILNWHLFRSHWIRQWKECVIRSIKLLHCISTSERVVVVAATRSLLPFVGGVRCQSWWKEWRGPSTIRLVGRRSREHGLYLTIVLCLCSHFPLFSETRAKTWLTLNCVDKVKVSRKLFSLTTKKLEDNSTRHFSSHSREWVLKSSQSQQARFSSRQRH